MLSAGIARSDNVLVVSFVKLFLFPNLLSCTLFAWTCFFIATISTGPSSWGDPLPIALFPDFCIPQGFGSPGIQLRVMIRLTS